MKTSKCKTRNSKRLKKLTLCICSIVVLCLFNLAALKAEEPTKKTSVNQQENTITTRGDISQSDMLNLQSKQQEQSRFLQLISQVMKTVSETTENIVRNLK